MKTLQALLDESAARHSHLCPRQVLGVRMGMLAGQLLGLDLPQSDKRLLVIAETDGCALDGLAVSTGCSVGRRTMRIEDYGKVAASFIDTQSGMALRMIPGMDARREAAACAPEAGGDWEAQLLGYQRIPALTLFRVRSIRLITPVEKILSRPGARAVCAVCGEEINNERELLREGRLVCRPCAGDAYYQTCEQDVEPLPAAASL